MKYFTRLLIIVSLTIMSCHYKGRRIILKESCIGIASETEYDRLKLIEPRKYWFEVQEMIAFKHAYLLNPGTEAWILKADSNKAMIEVKDEEKTVELWIDAAELE